MTNGEIELYMKQTSNSQENDSFIHILYDIGVIDLFKHDRKCVLLLIIHKLTMERFFNQLRTVEQTGYIVNSHIKYMGNPENPLLGLSFVIQSYKEPPYVLRKKIKAFISATEKHIRTLKNFKQYVDTITKELLKKDTNRIEVINKIWGAIMNGTYMFDRHKHLARILQTVSQDEVYKFFVTHFINKRTRKMRIVEFYKDLFVNSK